MLCRPLSGEILLHIVKEAHRVHLPGVLLLLLFRQDLLHFVTIPSREPCTKLVRDLIFPSELLLSLTFRITVPGHLAGKAAPFPLQGQPPVRLPSKSALGG